MKSVCAFGDSILKGVILDEDSKYKVSHDSFADICQKTLGIRVENAGKFGSTIKTGERSLERFGDICGYDYALLEFGGNDCDFNWKEIAADPDADHKPNSTIEDFRLMYRELIANVRAHGVKPVLLSLVPIDSVKYFGTVSKGQNGENIMKWLGGNVHYIANWHERYNLEVFKLASELDVPLIDITSPFLEERRPGELLCADGIHPNKDGHRLIADAIKDYIVGKFSSIESWQHSAC